MGPTTWCNQARITPHTYPSAFSLALPNTHGAQKTYRYFWLTL